MKRIQKFVGDDIYAGLIDCYKKLLAEGNKDKIQYFKALVHGCVRKWSEDDKRANRQNGFVPLRTFLRGNGQKDFLSYVEQSYFSYSSNYLGSHHTIYGYPTNELLKEIL